MVKQGTKDLDNVVVVPSGRWVLSYDTMPIYFEKATKQEVQVDASKDLEIFARYIAPPLGNTKRFVGEEPTDKVTRQYNRQMQELLGDFGIELEIIPRKELDGVAISASNVRRYMREGNWEAVKRLVPKTTLGAGKEFYPVIIPDLNRTDIGVEALKELSDTPVLMSILGHEVAHQFRYEDREKRNRAILLMLVYDYAEAIAKQIVRAANIEEDARLLTKESLQDLFQKALAKPIERWMRRWEKENGWADKSLGAFEVEYGRLRSEFIAAWNYRGELERIIEIFVKNLEKEHQCDKDILEENWEEIKNIIKSVKNPLQRSSGEIGEIKTRLGLIANAYTASCKQESEEEEIEFEYSKMFYNFENVSYDMLVEYGLSDGLPEQLSTVFWGSVYRCAVYLWEKKSQEYRENSDFSMFRAWNSVGRYFGLGLEGKMLRHL